MRHRRITIGFLAVNAAVPLFGVAGVLGRLTGLPAPLIVFGRATTAGIALTIVVLVHPRRPLYPRSRLDALTLAAQGVLLAAHWVMFFQSINVAGVAVGLLSFSSFPLFAVILQFALLREEINLSQLVGALLVVVGLCFLVPSLDASNNITLGVLWGLGAGASFALLAVTNRYLTSHYASSTIALYQDLIAGLVLVPTLFFLPAASLFTPRSLVLILIIGLCCTALAHTLFIIGLTSLTVQSASLLASLEPVWGVFVEFLLTSQLPSARTIVGGTIILLATVLPTVFVSAMR